MITAIKKLIEQIDELALWLKDNPHIPFPSQYKEKAIKVLNQIINAQVIEEDNEKFETVNSSLPKSNITQEYTNCPYCQISLSLKEIKRHNCKERKIALRPQIIPPQKKSQQKKIIDSKKTKEKPKGQIKKEWVKINYNNFEGNRRKH